MQFISLDLIYSDVSKSKFLRIKVGFGMVWDAIAARKNFVPYDYFASVKFPKPCFTYEYGAYFMA
jgi:hypothetical protein